MGCTSYMQIRKNNKLNFQQNTANTSNTINNKSIPESSEWIRKQMCHQQDQMHGQCNARIYKRNSIKRQGRISKQAENRVHEQTGKNHSQNQHSQRDSRLSNMEQIVKLKWANCGQSQKKEGVRCHSECKVNKQNVNTTTENQKRYQSKCKQSAWGAKRSPIKKDRRVHLYGSEEPLPTINQISQQLIQSSIIIKDDKKVNNNIHRNTYKFINPLS